MPDMRDAIAQQLMMGGGRGMMAPRPGIPSNLQGYPQLPSGQFLPTPISDTGPMPGMPPSPPNPNMQPPTNAPPQQYPGLDEFGNAPGLPPNIPGPSPGQDTGGMGMPPVNTPMQAPMDPGMIPPGVPQAGPPAGQQVGGMDRKPGIACTAAVADAAHHAAA